MFVDIVVSGLSVTIVVVINSFVVIVVEIGFIFVIVVAIGSFVVIFAVVWSLRIASVVFEMFVVIFKQDVGCVVIVVFVSGLKRMILQKASWLKEKGFRFNLLIS